MDLVFYGAERSDYERQLLASIRSQLPNTNVIVCRTHRDLEVSLLRPLYDVLAVILTVEGDSELNSLLEFEDVLFRLRVILVLNAENDSLVEAGCGLRPRYIAMRDEAAETVVSVLLKMTGRIASARVA